MTQPEAQEAKLAPEQLASLKHLAAIATTKAAESLAGMIDHDVAIETFDLVELELGAAQSLLGDPEDLIVAL